MSLKFQTRKWDVEITWEQMTLTPLGTANGDSLHEHHISNNPTNASNNFLFNLIEQMFAPKQTQEHLQQ